MRTASRQGDVVVVYLHWGEELQGCPTAQQRITARALAEAGADIVVGSHAHVLLGSGWMGDTYVDYGLGNFLWYHNHEPESGVLELRSETERLCGDAWTPARIRTDGRPLPLVGTARAAAVADWRGLRRLHRPRTPTRVLPWRRLARPDTKRRRRRTPQLSGRSAPACVTGCGTATTPAARSP